eukprot:6274206-Ditylum_brightwellii.AAC.1
MPTFQIFEQPIADIIQASNQGFLIKYLFDDRSEPFEEWTSNQRNAAAIKLQSVAWLFLQQSKYKPLASTVQNDLPTMLEEMKEDLAQDKKKMYNYFKERETKWANFFNSYRISTVISIKERQQWHQDQDAVTRIQRIVCGFIQQKFNFASLQQQSVVIMQASLRGYSTRQQLHLQQIPAISIQAVACEFIVQQQMITKHIAVVIIQTNFCLAYQQHIIYKHNDELLDN